MCRAYSQWSGGAAPQGVAVTGVVSAYPQAVLWLCGFHAGRDFQDEPLSRWEPACHRPLLREAECLGCAVPEAAACVGAAWAGGSYLGVVPRPMSHGCPAPQDLVVLVGNTVGQWRRHTQDNLCPVLTDHAVLCTRCHLFMACTPFSPWHSQPPDEGVKTAAKPTWSGLQAQTLKGCSSFQILQH